MVGVGVMLLSVAAGLVFGVIEGSNAFQEALSQVDLNDPVAQGSTPLAILPSLFTGGLAGLSVLVYGLAGGCGVSLLGFLYALVYPWGLALTERKL